jgi:mycofactocin biosynthetic radical S-adenosylmethionine protein MftC
VNPTQQAPSTALPSNRRLRTVFLHVTKACNMECTYCYFSPVKTSQDEMCVVEYKQIWPDLVELHPEKVVFTGGEPLMRDDLPKLLSDLRLSDPDHRIKVCVNSNGLLVTRCVAEGLIGLTDEVRVSVDALSSKNDALRGAGSFEAAVRALEMYRDVGFDPKVLITVTRRSLSYLEELLCYLIIRRFVSIKVGLFRPIGRGMRLADWKVTEAEVRESVEKAAARLCSPVTITTQAPGPTTPSNCGVGGYLNVMPNGEVFPCYALMQQEFRCGNLREESIGDIWSQSSLLDRLRSLDFRTLAISDQRLAGLVQPGACLGEMYAAARNAKVWKECLPLAEVE